MAIGKFARYEEASKVPRSNEKIEELSKCQKNEIRKQVDKPQDKMHEQGEDKADLFVYNEGLQQI